MAIWLYGYLESCRYNLARCNPAKSIQTKPSTNEKCISEHTSLKNLKNEFVDAVCLPK